MLNGGEHQDHKLGTVHYLYPRGVGDSYVIYKNLVALPPLDDLNVEDPPIKY